MDILNHKSGLLGISGISSDMRDILAEIDTVPQAKLAIDIFVNRVTKYIGAYLTELEHTDDLVFTGGIGENVPLVRRLICEKLKLFGVELSPENEKDKGQVALISSPASKIAVWVIPTNEELMIARDVFKLGNYSE